MSSPFLTPTPTAEADSLAVLHLRRNLQIPTILRTHDDENLGYDEGKVTNTRFGSFPHTTLIGSPWGYQIAASNVDTGSRGRRSKAAKAANHLKRKRAETDISESNNDNTSSPKAAVSARSGFIHILQPTPESWTSSLPHRTQVVYTPDYSYILHRLRVRPGDTIIEAGAGSGSFTHAAARAVFNGYPSDTHESNKLRRGKVCSFEFHTRRVETIREEIHNHGLEGIVRLSHRDVCEEGFRLSEPWSSTPARANAIFLDLPAPWLALKHLVREPQDGQESPLDPSSPIHICTFSPCLEQAQRTITTLRQFSWQFISMVEVAHRHIEVRRDRCRTESDGTSWSTSNPGSVEQVVGQLRIYEARAKAFRERQTHTKNDIDGAVAAQTPGGDLSGTTEDATTGLDSSMSRTPAVSDQSTHNDIVTPKSTVPSFRQGALIHRSEPELRTHTSYLVFAILPCDWSAEDEQRCREKWPSRVNTSLSTAEPPKSKKQLKREARAEEERQMADNSKLDQEKDPNEV